VSATETGNEMLKQLETKPYDVVIIDVQLEDVNGLDLLNRIQTMHPEMKKIILTSYPSSEDKIKALELGADYYLSKPIKPEKLIELVKHKKNSV
jgi:DNA-binding response OmpR family regulator